jgi:hypothetical protein
MRGVARLVLGILVLVAAPHASDAQGLGSIAGVVRDTSGGVLPGVTVEAASPALIEKVRTAVTDSAGQYTIVSLPLGTYSVTFTLPGFTTTRREGIELLANFTSSVNAEMRVGVLEETITVTGEAPVVDVQSATTTRAVTPEVIRAVPNGRTMYNLASMYTGVNISGTAVDVGGQTVLSPGPQLFAHGGRPGDELQMLDGIRVGNLQSNAGRTGFALSPLLWEQVDVVLSGQAGDSPTLGVQTNAIPKSGGNTMAGIVLVDGAVPSLQSSNLTSRLSATSPDLSEIKPWGLTGTSSIKSLWDLNASLGGPVAVDKVWFYGTGRGTTSESYLAGHYFPVDPRARVRVIDPSRQVSDDQYLWDTSLRLTSTVTPKMRWTNFGIYQHKIFRYFGFNPSTSPEASPRQDWPRYFLQTGWTYTATNRLLFEAGWNYQKGDTSARLRDDQITGTRYVETGGTFDGVVVPPMTYGAPGGFNDQPRMRIQAGKASMSYVTGTHNAKFGSDVQLGSRTQRNTNYSDHLQYRTTNYIVNQVTIAAPIHQYTSNLDYNLSFYAQDRWTTGKMTLTGGGRLELQKESRNAYTTPWPSKYLAAAPVTFPAADVVSWKDFNPRVGFSYDVFGDGKTAVKASMARGVLQEGINTADAVNPGNALITSTARTVNETTFPVGDPRRLNGLADCDLVNPAANGECGPWLTAGFGSPASITQQDPRTLEGWNVRQNNWEFSAGLQRELMPRVSADVTYFRRIYGNFLVTDNTANVAADFTKFGLVVPDDRRLETARNTVTVFDINPVLVSGRPFNTTTNVRTFASDYGKQVEHWDGVDMTMNARLRPGASLQGGVTFGRTTTDICDVAAQLPEVLGNSPLDYCHNVSSWGPQYKAFGVYELPWGDVRVSGNFFSRPGPAIQAGVIYTGAQIAPSLGRPFSAGAAGQKTVNVLNDNTVLGDRLNQFDLRFSRIFRFAGQSLDANLDLFNAFNSDAVLAYTPAYSGTNGGAWLRPTTLVQGRIIKFGVRWDF